MKTDIGFTYRQNGDGTFDSICLHCFLTVGTAESIEALKKNETVTLAKLTLQERTTVALPWCGIKINSHGSCRSRAGCGTVIVIRRLDFQREVVWKTSTSLRPHYARFLRKNLFEQESHFHG
jgi:hypothetical protein